MHVSLTSSGNAIIILTYLALALWSNNLRDTDAGLHRFYQACVDAGPLACPIHESSAQKIHDRVQSLFNKLRSYPISFYNAETMSYGRVDYSVLKQVMFATLYKPYNTGKELVSAIADLEQGIAEPMYQLSEMKRAHNLLLEAHTCPVSPRDPSMPWRGNTLAIACGDGDPVQDGVDELRSYYEDMAESSMFADIWWPRIGCAYVRCLA